MSDLTIDERLARLERALTFHDDGTVELRCHRVAVVDQRGDERIVAELEQGVNSDRAQVKVLAPAPEQDYTSYVTLYADDAAEQEVTDVASIGLFGVLGGDGAFHLNATLDGAEDAHAFMDLGEKLVASHHQNRGAEIAEAVAVALRSDEPARAVRDLDRLRDLVEAQVRRVEARERDKREAFAAWRAAGS
jgi:hypothetical protein